MNHVAGARPAPSFHLTSASVEDSLTPLFILAPHRSFTSVLSSMLGQHPRFFSLPETNLFVRRWMWQWWAMYRGGEHIGGHGLLRAVAEAVFGGQDPESVELARRWLYRRLGWPTSAVFATLGRSVEPLRLVEKSPRVVYNMDSLVYLYETCPDARFIHVLRHPVSHGVSLLRSFEEIGIAKDHVRDWVNEGGDPQESWVTGQLNIMAFLAEVPSKQQLQIHGEDLLAETDAVLGSICEWLGVSHSAADLGAMKHPERSPFAKPGPPSAPLGLDPGFMAHPTLRPQSSKPSRTVSLREPLPWATTRTLEPEVRQLALELGYR